MNYLPSRYKASSVARFVPVLRSLIDQHKTLGKTTIQFDPATIGLSVNTAIARLRDAVHSLTHKLTGNDLINPDDLVAIWSQYRLTSNGSVIFIQPVVDKRPELDFISSSAITLSVDRADFVQVLTALAVCLGHRVLQTVVTIDGDLPSGLQKTLEAQYDIAITQTGPHQHTML